MKKATLAFGAIATTITLGVFTFILLSGGGDKALTVTGPEMPDALVTVPPSTVVPVEETRSSPASPSLAERTRLSVKNWPTTAIASDEPEVRARALEHRLRNWARDDAPAAAGFARQLDEATVRNQAMRIVAQSWGENDPGAAVAWASALPDEIERRVFLGAVCLGLGDLNPAEGVRLAEKLGLRDDGVLENLTTQWAARDEPRAYAWVYQQPAGLDRDRLMQRIASTEAQRDPADAARLVVEQIPGGPEQTEAVITVVNQWVQRDPAGAADWVDRFPPGVIRERALGELRGLAAAP